MRHIIMKSLFIIVVALTALQSYAAKKQDAILTYGADGITISIINHTGATCNLEHYDVKQGLLTNSFPASQIPPSLGGVFYIYELVSGPEITLVYSCGGKKISLYNQQNASFLWAGRVQATVLSADPGITAYAKTERGSQIVLKTGKIFWTIEDN